MTVSRAAWAQANEETEVPPRPGEICVVCNKPIGADDHVYLIHGQRVPLHRGECTTAFKKDPGRYLARLKPQGNALMDEASSGQVAVSDRWLAAGIYVLVGLLFAGLSAYTAVNRHLNPVTWCFAGFFLNLPAYLVLLTRPRGQPSATAASGVPRGMAKVPATYAPARCPFCGAPNHPSASRCASCGRELESRISSEVARTTPGR